MSDSTLTDEQRENVMKEIEKKDSIAMDMVFNTIEANITNAVGIQLLPSYAAAFELDKQKSLVEKIPAQFANNDRIVKLKKHIETVEKTAVGQKYIDFSMDTPEGQTVKLSDFISKNKYTLIDFWASWCGPCMMLAPVMEALDGEMDGVRFCKVNVDEQPNLASMFGIDSIPTLAVVQDRHTLTGMVGVHDKADIKAMLEKCKA